MSETKSKTAAIDAQKRENAKLQDANRELKERLIDSMDGEIQARRTLEQVRQYAGRLEQQIGSTVNDQEE